MRDIALLDPLQESCNVGDKGKHQLTTIFFSCPGFDFGVAGTATAFPAFQKTMGIPWPNEPSGYLIPARYQSGWSGASTAGDVVGIMISGQIMERIGRKHTLALGSIITAIGVGIQVGSPGWAVFLVGRSINGIVNP